MVSYFSCSQDQWILWTVAWGRAASLPLPKVSAQRKSFVCSKSATANTFTCAPAKSLPCFILLSQNNRKPTQCSFQWPWCASIYKLARQSASFIESISLCACLWNLSYLHNWGHYIAHKSTNTILSCMEMSACLYCYFIYHCLSAFKYWFILECIEFKPLFTSLPWFRNIIFKTSIPIWKYYTEFNVLDLKFRSFIRDKCHFFC